MGFLDLSQLRYALIHSGLYSRIELCDTTGSTNSDVLKWELQGDTDPTLQALFARHQTAGRGRLHRQWISPRDKQLICSLLYTPPSNRVEDLGLLPLAVGLAIVTALGEPAVLKWPNDVLIGGKKLCGILAQVDVKPLRVAIGFGLNLSLTAQELPVPHATSLQIEGLDYEPTDLAISILQDCSRLLAQWSRGGHDCDLLLDAYRRRCSTLGVQVRLDYPAATGTGCVVGRALDIDSAGQLILETSQGVQSFAAGDVTHLRLAEDAEIS